MSATSPATAPGPAADDDRWATARAVADATLYEGYVLYPYRASSAKNRVRWQFGVLAPRAFSEADGSERWRSRTECLVEPGQAPVLHIRVRFLQLVHRTIEAVGPDGSYAPVDALPVGGVRWVPWDEAAERIVDLPLQPLLPLAQAGAVEAFRFAPETETEELTDADAGGAVVGRIVRQREAAEGEVHLTVGWAAGINALLKLSIEVRNTSAWGADGSTLAGGRDANLGPSLLGVHTLLAVDDGLFASLIDPPDGAVEAVADCTQDGTFPVLIGGDDAEGDQWADVVLSSPITLYDHPVIAPESQGDLFDATEIDEILALRVLTLTDEEKAEARGTDPRAAAIVDRCDDMPPEVWERLHGAVRSLDAVPTIVGEEEVPWWDPAADASVDPWTDTLRIGDVDVGQGTKVRLRPNRRSDAHDFFVDGMDATVAGIFSDVDGSQQVAVSLDDDPATEELAWQGRYLFFFPDEVEVIP